MQLIDLKTYGKFLSRHKLYTFINIFGFSVSLMFIILLGRYIQQELSVDSFHKNADRIYLFASEMKESTIASFANVGADYIKEHIPEVESFTRIVQRDAEVRVGGGDRTKCRAMLADSTFFQIFSFPLYDGSPSTVLNTETAVVLSRSYARKLFGNEYPVGKTLEVDDRLVTVTGLMEDIPSNSQIGPSDMVLNYSWVKYYWGDEILTQWNNFSFPCYFLAKNNTDLKAKETVLLDALKQDCWIFKEGVANGITFIPLKEAYFSGVTTGFMDFRSNNKSTVMVYLGIALLILVVSMLNYINMSVSQAGFRGREAATKKLLGCPRSQLLTQLMGESVAMTSLAFVLGLLLALLTEPYFGQALNTQLNLASAFTPNAILFMVVCVLLIGIVAGLAPALIISHFNPLEVVKGSFSRKIKSSYSKILITFQYTVAIVLLITSTFILLQTRFLREHDLGFDHDAILVMENVMGGESMSGLKDRLKSIAGVEQVSFARGNPLESGGTNQTFSYKGAIYSFSAFIVDSAFFDLFKIKIKPIGNAWTENSWVVNPKGFAALNPDASSYTIKTDDIKPGSTGWTFQICGITNEFNFRPLQEPIGLVMLKIDNNSKYPTSIIVKLSSTAHLAQTVDAVKREYSAFNGQKPFDLKFSDDIIQQWYTKETNTGKIITAFTILTLVILVMGIFAMSLYFIRQKEREIAIRKVNGATELQILGMLNELFAKNILVSFVIAVPIAYFAIDRWLQNFAYKIPIYWWVFVLSGVVIFLLSMLTTSWQAYKAAIADPARKLSE